MPAVLCLRNKDRSEQVSSSIRIILEDRDSLPQMAHVFFNKIHDAGVDLERIPYAVNIGCGDGYEYNDPVYALYKSGFKGVAIDAQNLPKLSEYLGPFGIELRPGTPVSTQNVVSILHGADCPETPSFLKIDIDGFDADILCAILVGGIRPNVIQAEINSEIPPPYAFSVRSGDSYYWGGAHGFFGFSLSYGVDILSPFGYKLVELDFETPYAHDALWAHESVLAKLGIPSVDPFAAFMAKPAFLPHIDTVTPEEKFAWRTRTDRDAVLAEIRKAMQECNRLKHGHTNVPFDLYISKS
jgi:hypothetical protein